VSPARRSRDLRAVRRVFGATMLLALGAVALALYTQHGLDMQPCSWCVLIRLIFVAMALVALPGLLLRSAAMQRVLAALLLLLAASGCAASLWLHFVASSSTSCTLSLADRIVGALGLDARWPEVFAAYASCSDAAVTLFGVPYVVFSLVLFVAAGAAAVWMLRRCR
jgi:disulfide bond formation protein DsbB